MHCQTDVRGVRNGEEFAAWQLVEAFKSEVFALLKGSREAMRDLKLKKADKNQVPRTRRTRRTD